MQVTDIIFALVSGRVIGILLGDFLKGWGINIGFYWWLAIWFIFPLISLFLLWISYLIGRRLLFVFQGAKHLLVGASATVVDLKIFELLVWVLGIFSFTNPIASKVISFLASTLLKYLGNKYWTFQKPEKEYIYKEIIQFFYITFVGLLIDVASFYYLIRIMGPQFAIPDSIWVKLSIIFAALAAALWNFLGYKFLVFKK